MGKVCYTDHDFSLDPLVSDPVFFHSLCSVKQCECVSHLVLEHYMDQQVRYLVFLIRNSMCTGKIYVFRHFHSDIWLQWSHGVEQVWWISERTACPSHCYLWRALVWLHRISFTKLFWCGKPIFTGALIGWETYLSIFVQYFVLLSICPVSVCCVLLGLWLFLSP